MGPNSPLAPILDRWNQLSRGRQLALAGIVAGTVVVLYFVLTMSTKPNLVVAYTGLAPEDAAAVADELERQGIPYELGGGGSTVSVPANKVAETRILLAQAGLPTGGSVGFEIFDKTNFGATDFVQQVNFRRALEGELARSINTLEGVKASRVHIVVPQEAIFAENQKDATASVVLQLERGATLSQSQVRGIANLVSHSVEGLELSGVTIVNSTGTVLFDGASFDSPFASGATASQLELQHQYELALQRAVEQILVKTVGAGRSAVTVNARLDFDTVTEEQRDYGSPEDVVPRSSTTVTESFTGTNLTVGGIPGTDANLNPGDGTGNGGETTYTRTDTTVNNEVNQTITTRVQAPGRVERLSVSVVLDESVTAAQESAITSAVAAAVGLDQTRGDTLSVTRLPFDASAQEGLIPAAGDGVGQYLDYLKLVLPMLAVVLAFVLVLLLIRNLGKRQLALPAPASQPIPLAAAAAAAQIPEMPPLPELDRRDPEEERVLRLAEANPRAVADVVQTWMREEG